jgi:hypothetical protein
VSGQRTIIEFYVNHDIKNINENCSLDSNPLRLPLAPARSMLAGTPQLCCDPASNRGRDKRAPPLLRGGWEGLSSVMIYEKINNSWPAHMRISGRRRMRSGETEKTCRNKRQRRRWQGLRRIPYCALAWGELPCQVLIKRIGV